MSAHLGGAQGFHHWAEHVMRADGPATVALLDPDEFFLEPLTQVYVGCGGSVRLGSRGGDGSP